MAIEGTLAAMLKALLENNRLLRLLLDTTTGDLVKVSEAEKRLGIHRSTINRRLAEGVYTRYRDGSSILVNISEIREKRGREDLTRDELALFQNRAGYRYCAM